MSGSSDAPIQSRTTRGEREGAADGLKEHSKADIHLQKKH